MSRCDGCDAPIKEGEEHYWPGVGDTVDRLCAECCPYCAESEEDAQ